MAAHSLPWTIPAGGVFRIRRVGDWLDVNTGEVTQRTGGLAQGSGEIVTLDEYVQQFTLITHADLILQQQMRFATYPD